MKIVFQPTEHLLIKAKTTSQWDSCDFAIVEVSKVWQSLIRSRLKMLEGFTNDESFFSLVYWDEPLGYFVHRPEEEDELRTFLNNDDELDCVFVSFEEDDRDKFMIPQNRLDAHQLLITGKGQIVYRAYGKYSGEEFFTQPIDAFKLLEVLQVLLP